jgi:2-dehydro-3-deoxyphosphooctonate aldolase (KDO 8-P synthase)
MHRETQRETQRVTIAPGLVVGDAAPLLLAGPCVIEEEDRVLRIAEALVAVTRELGIPFVFKSSFDKANRSSLRAYRGPGLERGLAVLARVKAETGVAITTDVHEPGQCEHVARVADVLQIPAFLCRQTDLLAAAARTGRVVSVKKGQFVAPGDMRHVVGKLEGSGCAGILLTERGSSFGYHNLVVDFRGLVAMRELGWPVLFDGTHSVQLPSAGGEQSSGERQYIAPLVRAAAAVGVDGLFLEVHDNPDEALCDGPNMLPLGEVRALLETVLRIREAVR